MGLASGDAWGERRLSPRDGYDLTWASTGIFSASIAGVAIARQLTAQYERRLPAFRNSVKYFRSYEETLFDIVIIILKYQ
jgi:hypothetical protein